MNAAEVQRCLEIVVQSGRTAHSYSYLDWHNPHPYLFVFIPPLIEIARTQFIVRWIECNTPFLEYVLSCVFVFSDRIFLIYFLYLFCIMNSLYDRIALDLDL